MDHVVAGVTELLRRVAASELVSRFGKLADTDVHAKPVPLDPTDIVTEADLAAEAWLSPRLTALVPGSVVVGEEQAAQQPDSMDALKTSPLVWLVDPLDGTRNFAAGVGPFGTMVALLDEGELVLGAIYLPLVDRLYTAIRGRGVQVNGRPLSRPVRDRSSTVLGTLYTKFMHPTARDDVERRARAAVESGRLRLGEPVLCAAHQYAELVEGRQDFALYQRLLPWDHASGALLLRESGGVSRHCDGREYRTSHPSGPIVVAASTSAWESARGLLYA